MNQGKRRLVLLKIKRDSWSHLKEMDYPFMWNEDEELYEVVFEQNKYDQNSLIQDPIEQLCEHYSLAPEKIIAHEDTSEEKLESWRQVVPLNKETDIKTAEEEILDTYDINKLRSIIEHGFPNALDGDDSSKPIKTLSFFGKYEEEIMEYFYNYSDELALQIWGNNTLDIYGYKHECVSTFIELVATKTIERLEGEG